MKNHNIIIDKNDFEQYKIPISLGNWLPKSKKKYIWEELEKRHPCFSDKFNFFSKDRISKHGVVSDVFVIEKSKLCNYKSTKIIINGKKFVTCINKKKKIVLSILFLILIFFCFFIAHGIIFKIQNKDLTIVDTEIVEIKNEENNFLSNDKKLLETILLTTKNNKGIIRNLNWKVTNIGEYITGTIENVYPETLEKTVIGTNVKTARYVDKRPFFDFSISSEFILNREEINKKISLKSREIIRNILIDKKIEIIEETTAPYKIVFYYPIEYELSLKNKKEMKLALICKELEKNNLYISTINITGAKNNVGGIKILMELGITESEALKNNCLDKINDYIDLFYEELKIIPVKKRDCIEKLVVNDDENIFLGEINYKNGKKTMFYKSPKGKLLKKEVMLNGKI